jgi:hypothetical protein
MNPHLPSPDSNPAIKAFYDSNRSFVLGYLTEDQLRIFRDIEANPSRAWRRPTYNKVGSRRRGVRRQTSRIPSTVSL